MLHEPQLVSIRRAAVPVGVLAAVLLLVLALPTPAWVKGMAGYSALHLVLELVAIVVALMVFAVSWSALRRHVRPDAVWLGAAFLGVALLDLGHALSYPGMPDFVTPSSPEKAIDFWLAARSLAALGLLGIVLRLPDRLRLAASPALGRGLLAAVLGLVALVYVVVIGWEQSLPRTFVPGVGLTPLKIGWEAVIVLCHLGVAALLVADMRRATPYDPASLLVATCALALGEVYFTLYADVTDHFNLLGHVYKVIGCVYLYRAIFLETVDRPYRQLAQAQARLRATLAGIPDLLWLKDTDGVYLDCNPSFERLYGAPRDRIVGRTDRDFVDEEQAAFFRHHDLKAMATGGPSANEEWLTFADGGYRGLFETVKTPVQDADGRVIGVLGIARDITERRDAELQRQALEAQLREAQKMESLGTLAGGVAHDFNNVLGAIRGHAGLAREQLPPDHPVQLNLEQIRRAGARARDLVQQILAFSRRQPQRMQRQPLRPLVEETVGMLQATLPARVRLRVQLADADLPVRADGSQIQQVLMNLCTNAWHALGDAGGEIEIGLQAAQPEASAGGAAWIHLWVRDTGAGMDEATRARIFEPFFTTKPQGKGTGLGLSVVHGIVSAHGGTIRVDSAPGAGSCFHIHLPLAGSETGDDAEASAPPAPAVAPSPGHSRRVLYVDDDEVMLVMVEQLLTRAGWRVVTRSRATDALALCRADPQAFDVVVTDYNMPDGSGLELASALKALRPGLPVIVSSGYLSEELMAGVGDAGVWRVLQKQDTLEELPRLLAELLPAGADV